MKKQLVKLLLGLLVAVGILGLTRAALPPDTATADNKKQPAAKPNIEGQAAIGAKRSVSQGEKRPPQSAGASGKKPTSTFRADPLFEYHVDLELLTRGICTLDPALLADVGLQLAEGERIFHRPHRSGLTAHGVLKKAVGLAARKKDKDTLARLTQAAERAGNKELLSLCRSAGKLAEGSRDGHPALRMSVEETKPETFARLKDLWTHIWLAETLGDAEEMKAVEWRLGNAKGLPATQKETLKEQLTKAKEGISPKPSASDAALAKLVAASRDDVSYSQWDSQYTAPDGQIVNAQVVIQGNVGSYAVNGTTVGDLSFNQPSIDTQAPLQPGHGPAQILCGTWSFRSTGETGSFEWHVGSDGSHFDGTWQSNSSGASGTWSGDRSAGGGGDGGMNGGDPELDNSGAGDNYPPAIDGSNGSVYPAPVPAPVPAPYHPNWRLSPRPMYRPPVTRRPYTWRINSRLRYGSRDARPEIEDAGFEQHVDVAVIADACDRVNPSQLTDAALQLAEGERVLQRKHRSGITAGHLLHKATTLAAQRGDKETLDRIKEVAEKAGDKELLRHVQSTRKLADVSRDIDLGLQIPLESTTPAAFVKLQEFVRAIKRAKLLNDAESLKAVEDSLKETSDLSVAQKEAIRRLLERTRQGVPEKPTPADAALRKLQAANRGFGGALGRVGGEISGGTHHLGGEISSGAHRIGGEISGGTQHTGRVIYNGYIHAGKVLTERPHDAGPSGEEPRPSSRPTYPRNPPQKPRYYYWIEVVYRSGLTSCYRFTDYADAARYKAAYMRQNLTVQTVNGPIYSSRQPKGWQSPRAYYWVRVDYQDGSSAWEGAYSDYDSALQGRNYYLMQDGVQAVDGPYYGGPNAP